MMADKLEQLATQILALNPAQQQALFQRLHWIVDEQPVPGIAETASAYGAASVASSGVPIPSKSSAPNQRGVLMNPFDRITRNPEVMSGKACIRDMRVTVSMVLGQIGSGISIDALLADYPYLEREDIAQALRYAAWHTDKRANALSPA